MAFHDVQFPTDYRVGAVGTLRFNTAIVETDSGQEQRIARWGKSRRSYQLEYRGTTNSGYMDAHKFFMARGGALHSFPFKDWSDYNSSSTGRGATALTDQNLGVGDNSEVDFQLRKAYVSGAVIRYRTITKPVIGTVTIGLDSVNQSSGWTVNRETGVVTFAVAPGPGVVVTAGFEFDVPCRFSENTDGGLTTSFDDPFNFVARDIELIEVIDEREIPDDINLRGAVYSTFTADKTLALAEALFYHVSASSGSLKILLPATTNLFTGGPYWIVRRDGGSAFDIEDADGNTIVTAAADATDYTLYLGYDSGGNKTWYALE